jgi:lipopolysaccharide/colanic/teichoic acid biosynthesis glycosyltransferase
MQDLPVSFQFSGRRVAFSDRPSRHVKRIFDVSTAFVLVLLLAPLLLAIAALVRGADGGPALFRQVRIGKGGKPFRCWKFRTMSSDAERALQEFIEANPDAAREWRENQKLSHDPRITRIGSFLRKSSLDELPQLFNILVGDMSFVGPRPIVVDEIERYGEAFSHCFSVQPGLTGLWQVSGRSDCGYASRVALDGRYVAEWHLLLDIEILVKTVPAVLLQKGSR